MCVCGGGVDLLLKIVKYSLLWKEKGITIYKEQIHGDFLDIYCQKFRKITSISQIVGIVKVGFKRGIE